MLDSQLQAIIQSTLTAAFTARGVAATVKQNNQPRQMIAVTGPAVYFSGMPAKPYGWPNYKLVWNPDTGVFDRTRIQVLHSRFTVGCVAPISAATPNAYTSRDLAVAAMAALQDQDFIASLVPQDCNVFRVTELPSIWFQDNNAQNVNWVSFDIIFTHSDIVQSVIHKIDNFNGTFDRV
jgi:hypothetical protein